MTCKEARYNLLASEVPAAPTAEVERHLADCPRCRKQQRRLAALERELADLARPGESPDARQQVLERIAALPTTTPVIPLPRPAARPRHWLAATALVVAAACLLAAIFIGGGNPPAVVPTYPAGKGPPLVASMVDDNLKLARLTTVPEQVETLVDMANRLQAEAVRLARQGQTDEAAWLRDLHQQVVARGLAGRGRILDANQRQELAQLLRNQADQAAAEAVAMGEAGQPLRLMSQTSRQAADTVLAARWPAPPPLTPPNQTSGSRLLDALVYNGLRLAEDPDPLRRADYCTDMADSLLLSIRAASTAGQADTASALSQQLGEVMNRGVSVNLALAESAGAAGADVERVRARASQATSALEGVLAKAPAPARASIQQALDASRKGLEKAKGKGLPAGKGKDFVPPGLQKIKGMGHHKGKFDEE